jgi:putative ECF transporter S component (TIGR02185 family)
MVPFFPAVWALINGTVFMLYTTKVEKFGLVTLMGVLTGLLVGLTGMGFWCAPTGLVFGLLGDLIMKKGNYKSFKHNLIGYAVFSIWTSGSLIGTSLHRTHWQSIPRVDIARTMAHRCWLILHGGVCCFLWDSILSAVCLEH